jgi:hypothetical protein
MYENIDKVIHYKPTYGLEAGINSEIIKKINTYIILFGYDYEHKQNIIYYDVDGNKFGSTGHELADIYQNEHLITEDELEEWLKYESTQTLKIYNCDYDTDKYKKPIEKPTFSVETTGGKQNNSNNILFYIFISLIILVIIIRIKWLRVL